MSSLWRVAHRRGARSGISSGAGEVVMAVVRLVANASAGIFAMRNGVATISVGLLIRPMSEKMPNEDDGIAFQGRNPSTLFREVANASARNTRDEARGGHHMAQHWEKKS